jgi:hypothetical protein
MLSTDRTAARRTVEPLSASALRYSVRTASEVTIACLEAKRTRALLCRGAGRKDWSEPASRPCLRRLASRRTATVKVMIVMRGEIGGEFVEISLGNRSCDPQEFLPDGRTLPLGSAGRCPYPARTRMRSISFPGCCHGVIIAKSNRWHKEATKNQTVPQRTKRCQATFLETDECVRPCLDASLLPARPKESCEESPAGEGFPLTPSKGEGYPQPIHGRARHPKLT